VLSKVKCIRYAYSSKIHNHLLEPNFAELQIKRRLATVAGWP
jgi:hypothetical protein